ncbi:zinc knuckle CX2CX4HX4C containing protein [Tanacetum coccineum]
MRSVNDSMIINEPAVDASHLPRECEDVMMAMTSVERIAAMEAIEAVWKKILAGNSSDYPPLMSDFLFLMRTIRLLLLEYSPKGFSTPLGTFPEAIQSLLEKFLADMSNLADNSLGEEQFANEITGYPSPDTLIVRSVSISKPVSKGLEDVIENEPWMIHNSPIILKKWTMNTSLFIEELTHIPVWVKLHDVPLQVFSEDGISLIATLIGKPVMLDSFIGSMCTDSWGRGSFARCLIEVITDAAFKDSVTTSIPLLDGEGFTKETVQVEYEWKPPCCDQCKIFGHVYDQCLENVTVIPTVYKMNNDGFQTVVNKRKSGKTGYTINNRSDDAAGKATWQPIKEKVRYESKIHENFPKNGAPKVSTSAKNDHSKKLPAKNGGVHSCNPYDVPDDMESEEEVEAVYDETVNL